MSRTVTERLWQGESVWNPITKTYDIRHWAWYQDVESVLEETNQGEKVVSQRVVGYGRAG